MTEFSRRYVWISAIAVFVIVLTFLACSLAAQAHTVDEPGTYTVHMDADGFNPDRLKINQGEQVTFENVDTKLRWPASNIHPTHTVYPGSDIAKCGTAEMETMFDACRGLEPEEEFTFIFNEPGRWRYHDHLRPQATGEIVVRATGDRIEEKRPNLVERLHEWFSAVREWAGWLFYRIFPGDIEAELDGRSIAEVANDKETLKRLVYRAGPERVMSGLLEETGGGSELDCHQPAHQIGRVSYEVFGASAFEKGDASCHSGYYHGAMEAFLAEEGTDDLAAEIGALCSIFETSFGIFECLHGVGHGVMAYENYDLPAALAACEELKDDFSIRSCYGGVFMENVVAGRGLGAISGHETEWVSDDSHFPCNAVGDSYDRRYECYQMQTSWMLTLNDYDFSGVARECQDAPLDMVAVCYKSLGRDAAGHTLRDPKRILDICSEVSSEEGYYDSCVTGAVNVVIDFWGPQLKRQAHELCQLVPERDSQVRCLGVVEGRLPELF